MAEFVSSSYFPVLEDGNQSFENATYKVDLTPLGDDYSILINHKLERAPFLQKLLNDGKVKFGCVISIPKTGYRKLMLAEKIILNKR